MRLRSLLLLLVAGLLFTGCATTRGDRSLGFLKGRRVLVVWEGSGAATREAETARALALVPLRVHPADADPGLGAALPAGERVEAAREVAEERRIPWLLVRGEREARVENARGGAVRWQARLRGPGDAEDHRLAGLLTRDLLRGRESGEGVLDPRTVRTAPAAALRDLRRLVVERRWQEHRDAVLPLLEAFPADPALRTHEGLQRGLDGQDADLERAVAMNPDGESELLALALLAEDAGDEALTLLVRRALVRRFPARLDYRPALADAVAAVEGPGAAVDACRGGLGAVDAEAMEAVPAGAAPHDHPDALPYADLRFELGWTLRSSGDPQAAALHYETAALLYDRLGRPGEWAKTMNNAGVALVEAGRPGLAVVALRKAVRQRRKEGDPGRLAATRYNLARALADAGRPDDALQEYRKAAEDYVEAGSPASALEVRIEALGMHALRGDRSALQEEAEALLDELQGDAPPRVAARADVLFEVGSGLVRFEEHEGALEAYRRAAEGYASVERRLDEAQTRYSMATPNVALFRFEEALADLDAALQIALLLNDTESVVVIRNQIDRVQGLLEMRRGRAPGGRSSSPAGDR